jgi:hypothetical protein
MVAVLPAVKYVPFTVTFVTPVKRMVLGDALRVAGGNGGVGVGLGLGLGLGVGA